MTAVARDKNRMTVAQESSQPPSQPGAGAGYRSFVDPAHPLVEAVFGPPVAVDRALPQALEAVRATLAYHPVRGRVGFDTVLGNLESADADPSEPATIANCIDLSCLLAARLRACGWTADQVWVVVCDVLSAEGRAATPFHACLLARPADGEPLWIPPESLEPEPAGPAHQDRLLDRLRLHLAFNDRHVITARPALERLLRGERRTSGPRRYLYGHADPAFHQLLDDPVLERLLRAWRSSGPRQGESTEVEAENPEEAAHLVDAGLVAEEAGELRPGPRLAVVGRQAERDFRTAVAPALDAYLTAVAATVPRLRRAYGDTTPADRFPWEAVSHTLVAGLLLDLAVGARLDFAEKVKESQGNAVVWAFEAVSAGNAFGVQWVGSPDNLRGVAQLWHVAVERPALRLSRPAAELLVRRVLGETVDTTSRHWLFLKFLGFLQRGEPTVPAFRPEDSERLLEPLMEGGDRLVREAVRPALEAASRLPRWAAVEDDPGPRHAAVRLILEYGVDTVLDAGLLEPFPRGRPAPAWGRWIWIEEGPTPRLLPTALAPEDSP